MIIMSNTERLVMGKKEAEEEDCWSDVDETLLAQCDHIENEGTGSATENQTSSPEEGDLAAETPDAGGGNDTRMSEVSQTTVKEVTAGHAPVKVSDIFKMGEMTPLQLFNKGDYLCVTDLTQQLWCEQHLCFTLMGVEPPAATSLEDGLPVPLPTADRPEVKAGKSVHLARELEVHDVVSVSVTSRADKWGLHVLNLLSSMRVFLAGGMVAREVPIFGDPFGSGDLVFGIIDELRFDPEAYRVTLTELKTRRVRRYPGKAQTEQHRLQVLLYKRLWDNLVSGNFSPDFFLSKLGLTSCSCQPLGEELLQHIRTSRHSATSLSDLLSLLLNSAQALVRVGSLKIEYVLQDTGSAIGQLTVEEDTGWLERTFAGCMDFWHGRRREARGVDVEEAWKCGTCEYSPVCEWRIRKSASLAAKNQRQRLTAGKKSSVCVDR